MSLRVPLIALLVLCLSVVMKTRLKLCCKGHIAVDSGEARIITAAALTGGAISDQHLLVGLLTEHESLVGRPRYVVADQKYGTTTNFRILKVKVTYDDGGDKLKETG